MTMHPTSAIKKAVTLVDGVANLAEACGVSAQAVYKWIKKGHPPIARCAAVERAVDGRISRFDLLPPPFINPKTTRPRKVPAGEPDAP